MENILELDGHEDAPNADDAATATETEEGAEGAAPDAPASEDNMPA